MPYSVLIAEMVLKWGIEYIGAKISHNKKLPIFAVLFFQPNIFARYIQVTFLDDYTDYSGTENYFITMLLFYITFKYLCIVLI